MMKITLRFYGACVILFAAALLFSSLDAGEFNDKGVVSGWKFFPLQVDVGLVNNRKLVDENTDTFISLGLFILQQKSAVISTAFVANTLQNNYGIQLNPLFMGTVTDRNYGISIGFENYCKKCYGIQVGVLNHFWDDGVIEKEREHLQILGLNIADVLHLGIANISNKIQIGLVNVSNKSPFQAGLLNYNHSSYLPLMPLINFSMGKKSSSQEQ